MRKAYKVKLNRFANLTSTEFSRLHTCVTEEKAGMILASDIYENQDQPPASLDWRQKGAVTDIKNQGDCGSCWASGTVATVEGINQIRTKKLVSLSAQELVNCCALNKGCGGGSRFKAFDFIKKNGGITTVKGKCDPSKAKGVRVTIDGY